MILDTALILFTCVSANHLGLVSAMERCAGREIPVLNCPKCLSFWITLIHLLVSTHMVIVSFAVSFLNAYLASWVELGMGCMDIIYYKVYDKIYPTADSADIKDSAVCNESDTDTSVPDLRKGEKPKEKKNKVRTK